MAVARYTLAVDRRFNRNNEQTADFISCVVFGKHAEVAEKYFHQGTKLVNVNAEGFMSIPEGIADDLPFK